MHDKNKLNDESKRISFVGDLLLRFSSDVNTCDICDLIARAFKNLKYYKERDLFKEPESKAKWILGQISFLESVISSGISMLHYVETLKSEIDCKEKCIAQLNYHLQIKDIDIFILKEVFCENEQAFSGTVKSNAE